MKAEYKKGIDFSAKRECYCSCPKCGSNNLGFGTVLSFAAYMRDKKLEYVSSITCLACLFRLTVTEKQAKEYGIPRDELNRQMWNNLKKQRV